MITHEQVADLQPGDVVRVTVEPWSDVVTEGPVTDDSGTLRCGPVFLRYASGVAAGQLGTLTVVSRAPRPLYVNHPRTEPVPGDVVREDGTDRSCIWAYDDPNDDDEPWRHILGHLCGTHQIRWTSPAQMPARLRLLVDGETGQVVTP